MKLLFLHHFTKFFTFSSIFLRASLVAQMVKNPAAMQEPQERKILSLGWKDPLEKGMATHSSILAWRIPMDRGAYQSTVHGVAKSEAQLNNFHFPCA